MHHARGKAFMFFDLDAKYDEVVLESLTPEELKQTENRYN